MADKTMVDYTQKIKPYLEGVALIEPTTTATSAHAVGAIFYLNGELVVATSAIAIGDTIVKTEGSTVGNCEDADDIVTMLAGKQSTLTFDNVPTENSNNPVKSGGVYSAEQNIYEVIGQNGAKNLLPFTMENIKAINTNGTWNGNSYTYNGITYVVSEDGVIEVSGTNNSGTNSVFYLVITESGPQFNFKLGRYKLNGCPAGGSDPTYSWYVAKTGQYNSDYGGGVTFEVTSETDNYWSLISVKTGTALEGTKTFKPMVWLASDSDATFQPYAKTNKELTYEISTLNSNKADKVSSAINGNFAGLDSNGNLTDSGSKASDFLSSSYLESSTKTTADSKDTFTFTNAAITANASFDVYSDVFGAPIVDMVLSGNQLSVSFNSSDNVGTCRLYIK